MGLSETLRHLFQGNDLLRWEYLFPDCVTTQIAL